MTWRYQIVKRDTEDSSDYYDIAEVFTDDKDRITNWTEDGIVASSETSEGVIKVLETMLKDAKALPVFDETEWRNIME